MMFEMMDERAKCQLRLQSILNVMIQSMINMVTDNYADDMSDEIGEEEFDLIITMSLLKGSIDLALQSGATKKQFLSLCEEIFDAVELHMSTPAGNA